MKEKREISVVGRGHTSISWNLDCVEQLSRVMRSCPKNFTGGVKKQYLENLNDYLYLTKTWEIQEK